MVEIDKAEIEKPTINIDMPIQSDIGDFLEIFNKVLDEEYMGYEFNYNQWVDKCNEWKNKYPVCDKLKYQQKSPINVYAFLDTLSSNMMEYEKIVVANGSACACIHGYKLKKGQRLVVNSGVASMGYDLPAACGACFGIGKKRLVCVSGDGSIQMNLQELQTIVHHKLPIKLFVINNNGYQSIRITQRSFFERPFVGIGGDSGDVSFPQMKKIANAYSIPYYSCNDISKLEILVPINMRKEGTKIKYSYVEYYINLK